MPVEWERDNRVFVVRAVGAYESCALINSLEAILGSEDFPVDAAILLDVSSAESLLRHSTREMREIADYFAEHSDAFGRRCALLVTGLARYGLMRMAAVWVEGRGVTAGVFRSEAEARAWLDAPHAASPTG